MNGKPGSEHPAQSKRADWIAIEPTNPDHPLPQRAPLSYCCLNDSMSVGPPLAGVAFCDCTIRRGGERQPCNNWFPSLSRT